MNEIDEGGDAQLGQASVEWVGLICLVSLALATGLTLFGAGPPGAPLVGAIAERIRCAASLGEDCDPAESPLVAAYGPELAGLVGAGAPRISYERGMVALPVDFRSCREASCSDGAERGAVSASATGEPATAFVRVIDCRGSPGSRLIAAGGSAEPGATADWTAPEDVEAALEAAADPDGVPDCFGEAAGNLYVQYWLYYPTSYTRVPGDFVLGHESRPGFHLDDWESFQLRIGPDGRMARASSHNGYNWVVDAGGILSDTGISPRPAWGPDSGRLFVSAGSHAGHASTEQIALARAVARRLDGRERRLLRRATRRDPGDEGSVRWTPADELRLVPLEPIAHADRGHWPFVVTPPWQRREWNDPESERTGWRP